MPLFLSHVAVKIRGLCSVYIIHGAKMFSATLVMAKKAHSDMRQDIMFVEGRGHVTTYKTNDSGFLLVSESMQEAAQIRIGDWTQSG